MAKAMAIAMAFSYKPHSGCRASATPAGARERRLVKRAIRSYLRADGVFDHSGLRGDGNYVVLADLEGPFAIYRIDRSSAGRERLRPLKRWPKGLPLDSADNFDVALSDEEMRSLLSELEISDDEMRDLLSKLESDGRRSA